MGVNCDRAYTRIDLKDFCHFLRRLPPQEPPTTPGKDHKAFPRLDNYRDPQATGPLKNTLIVT